MRINLLTYIILYVNSAIDSGKYQDISIEEIERYAQKGILLEYLDDIEDIDLSFILSEDNKKEKEKISEALGNLCIDEYNVENNGLCIVIAWLAELIQQEAEKRNN